jgi:hypothetical protein
MRLSTIIIYLLGSSYLTGDTLRLRYRVKPVNAMSDLSFFTAVAMKNVVFCDVTPCGT